MDATIINTQKFDSIIPAANSLTAPFTTNIVFGTLHNYSYYLYTAAQMQQNFGIDDPVWQYGGPILGFNLTHKNFVATTDCSGFIARVLNSVTLPNQQTSIYYKLVVQNGALQKFNTPQHPQPFPSAEDYANLFIKGDNNNWETITFSDASGKMSTGSFSKVLPGDLLAYGLPQGSSDTGHVMIINSVTPLNKGTLNPDVWGSDLTEFSSPNLTFFAVSVYDSSNVAHYRDNRGNAAIGNTGVGLGTVLLIGDSTGSPIGFMFNIHDKLLQTEPIETALLPSQISQLDTIAVGRAW
jgi:hypothetical protein